MGADSPPPNKNLFLTIVRAIRSNDQVEGLIFHEIFKTNFSRILTMRFRSSFLRPLSGRGSVDICKKNPTHEFIVSTKSRPKFAENQISNFHISHKWGGGNWPQFSTIFETAPRRRWRRRRPARAATGLGHVTGQRGPFWAPIWRPETVLPVLPNRK